MPLSSDPVDDVRQSIDRLIQAGTSFDIEALDQIYHDELQVIMIDANGRTSVANKSAFKTLFQTKRDSNEPPLNTWADIHRIDATECTAHALVSRKVKLTDVEQDLLLSIDLVKQRQNWQVIREVIFARCDGLA